MLTYADVACQEKAWDACVEAGMRTYADVCGRMLTYADVCGRMLTHADVC